jgi:hypothetical protein
VPEETEQPEPRTAPAPSPPPPAELPPSAELSDHEFTMTEVGDEIDELPEE